MDSHRKISIPISGAVPAVQAFINLLKLHGHALVFCLIAVLASFSSQQNGLALAEGAWRGVFSENDKEIPLRFTLTDAGSNPVLSCKNGGGDLLIDPAGVSEVLLIFPVEGYDSRLVGMKRTLQ